MRKQRLVVTRSEQRGFPAWLVLVLLFLGIAGAPCPSPGQPPQSPAAPPTVTASVTPEPGALILERRPAIAVLFEDPEGILDPASLTMEVDGVDVTLLLAIENGRVTYRSPADLAPGEHTVKVTVADRSGEALEPVEWGFKIRRFARLEEASVSGELTSKYQWATRKFTPETPRHLFENNLSIRGLLKEADVAADLEANIRYRDEFRPLPPEAPTEKLDIGNYRLRVTRDPLAFELGDVVINEGFFGSPRLSRRGMHALLKGTEPIGVQLHLFGTRYEATQGHDPFFGVEDSDSILYGGALTVAPLADPELLKLHVLNVYGRRVSDDPGSNVGTIVAGERGDLFSFGAASSLLGGRLKLEGEIALSKFDTDTTDEFKDQTDKAYRLRLEGVHDVGVLLEAPVQTRLTGEYTFVGFSFRSPSNPGLQPDRKGYSVKADTLWRVALVTLGYGAFHDNTDRLELIPTVKTRAWNGGIRLVPPDLPSVALNWTRAAQENFDQPVEFGPKRLDNVQDTYALAVAHAREAWNAELVGSLNVFRDRTFPVQQGDKNTWTLQATATLRPLASLVITPGLNYTRLEDKQKVVFLEDNTTVRERATADTWTATLTAAQELVPKILIADLQVSGTWADSSDRTVDNRTYGGAARLAWNVGKLFSDWGKQVLSLRTNFNRVRDHVSGTNRNDIGIFLILEVLAPYLF